MTIKISIPDVGPNLHPQITVLGVGGSGGNAVNNMINANLEGVDFVIANTDAQALQISNCKKKLQLGINSTRGLGAGMRPDIGRQAAEETIKEISEMLEGSHMLFIAAGMGGGTGTGAAPVIAKLAREKGILTVGVVTKPFHFEGSQRMKLADKGLEELQQYVDTLLTIPNQNLFRIANEKTTFADAFKMADDVLYAGVRGITDLMVQPGLINLDFSDVKTVMSEMGKAMMGTGEASGEGRAIAAAEAAIANPLIDDVSLKGAKGLIINITGGNDITLYEVDEAANRIKQEVDENANIIYGTTCDDRLEGVVRVSLVATGIDANLAILPKSLDNHSILSIDNSVYLEKKSKTDDLTLNVSQENQQAIFETNSVKSNIENLQEHVLPSLELEETTADVVNDEENQLTSNEVDEISEEYIADENDDLSEISTNILKNEEIQIEEELKEENNKVEEIIDENLKKEDKNSYISVNLEEKDKPSVRKLSLFDTLEDNGNENSSAEISDLEKSEPIFEQQNIESASHNIDEEKISQNIEETVLDEEFSGEENDTNEEYNQEVEEELLDIPTFLRRQAN